MSDLHYNYHCFHQYYVVFQHEYLNLFRVASFATEKFLFLAQSSQFFTRFDQIKLMNINSGNKTVM